jgi:hypothetical protein
MPLSAGGDYKTIIEIAEAAPVANLYGKEQYIKK